MFRCAYQCLVVFSHCDFISELGGAHLGTCRSSTDILHVNNTDIMNERGMIKTREKIYTPITATIIIVEWFSSVRESSYK